MPNGNGFKMESGLKQKPRLISHCAKMGLSFSWRPSISPGSTSLDLKRHLRVSSSGKLLRRKKKKVIGKRGDWNPRWEINGEIRGFLWWFARTAVRGKIGSRETQTRGFSLWFNPCSHWQSLPCCQFCSHNSFVPDVILFFLSLVTWSYVFLIC